MMVQKIITNELKHIKMKNMRRQYVILYDRIDDDDDDDDDHY